MSRSPSRTQAVIDRLNEAFKRSPYYLELKDNPDGDTITKDEKLLSVIIPARNEFPNIVHTFYSIMHSWEASGFSPNDIEVIIVSNCSDDWNDDKYEWDKPGNRGTTAYMVARGAYGQGDLRILYDPIAGNHSTRNKGARIARGKYLFFSDAHMAYHPQFFKYGLKALEETGGLVHGGLNWMGAYARNPEDSRTGMQYTIKLGEEWKGCVDEKTEILTESGWKHHNEVNAEDRFATLSVATKKIEYQKAREVVIRRHFGPMVKFKGRNIDQLLTPYHRTLFSKENSDSWEIKEAKEISAHDRLPIGSLGYREQKNKILSDEMVELLGWIITEGCYSKKYIYRNKVQNPTITITQYGEDKRKRIENLLVKMKLSYCIKGKKKRDFKIHQKDSAKIMKILPEKKLTAELIHKLTHDQMGILLNILVDGDGYRSKGHVRFVQSTEETIDNFQILSALAGYATAKYSHTNKGSYGKKDKWFVSVKKNVYATDFKREYVHYDGIVWCPDTPNGTIIIRRNGVVSLSGNTWNPYRPWSDDWFYIPAQGHASIFAPRRQFLEFGGYPEIHRAYGGGEFYLDMKWWMFGSTVVADPRCIAYHLASGRGYVWHHDHYIENVLGCSYALGCDDWRERTYINYLRRGRKGVLDEIMARNEKEYAKDRAFVENRRVKTFNDVIVERPWDKMNIAKRGVANSSMLIFHDTWLDLLKNGSETAKEAYANSKYQKQLEEFINKHLSNFVYKRSKQSVDETS